MKHIPTEAFPERSKENLRAFLVGCQKEAEQRDHWQLVNINLPVRHIEPLAVLHSIFESTERHFYLERPNSDEAIAGAESVLERTFSGESRFQNARQFAEEVLEHSIVFGETGRPFLGPQFFCGFTFSDFASQEPYFEPGAVFIPRWQVSRYHGHYSAVANLVVEKESDLDFLTEKVWSAHEKFSSFDYHTFDPKVEGDRQLLEIREAGGANQFPHAVSEALKSIRAGEYEKIVLARAIDLQMNQPYEPLIYLDRLREEFGGCYAFSFANGRGQSFIGVTPERLVQFREQELKTMALAGTVSRGSTVGEDARLARSLLESEKDLREHRVVIEAIVRRLRRLNLSTTVSERPTLMQLSNVQHLLSTLSSQVEDSLHILDMVEQLHPTPAVGGSPREVTSQIIHSLEPFDRGLYAGAIGYFDARGEGEFVVAIRSALVEGKKARIYAGSGIVEGSDPAREKQETDLKLKAMLPSLMG